MNVVNIWNECGFSWGFQVMVHLFGERCTIRKLPSFMFVSDIWLCGCSIIQQTNNALVVESWIVWMSHLYVCCVQRARSKIQQFLFSLLVHRSVFHKCTILPCRIHLYLYNKYLSICYRSTGKYSWKANNGFFIFVCFFIILMPNDSLNVWW